MKWFVDLVLHPTIYFLLDLVLVWSYISACLYLTTSFQLAKWFSSHFPTLGFTQKITLHFFLGHFKNRDNLPWDCSIFYHKKLLSRDRDAKALVIDLARRRLQSRQQNRKMNISNVIHFCSPTTFSPILWQIQIWWTRKEKKKKKRYRNDCLLQWRMDFTQKELKGLFFQ